jgi:hypothetical protein
MPGEAVALGAAGQVLPLDRISGALLRSVKPLPEPRTVP